MEKILFASGNHGLRDFLEKNKVDIIESLINQKELLIELGQVEIGQINAVVVTDNLAGPHNRNEMVQKLKKICDKLEIKIIMILDEKDDEYSMFLREQQIYNIFDPSSDPDDLLNLLLFEAMEDVSHNENEDTIKTVKEIEKHYVDKMILTVVSPGGGGTGKTTVAYNLATTLAKKHKHAKIALLELNEEKTDLFDFVESKTTVVGLDYITKKVSELSEQVVLDAMEVSTIKNNLFILPGLRSSENAPKFKPNVYKFIIRAVKKHYDFVIIDTGGFNAIPTIESVVASDRIMFVCSNTKKHLRCLNEKLDLYHTVVKKPIKEICDIVINFKKIYGLESLSEINDVMDIKPIFKIKYNEKFASAFAKNKEITKLNGRKAKQFIKALEKYIDKHFIYLKKK